MAAQQPSRGRKLRRLLITLLLVILCVWALPLASSRGVFDGDCASVAGDDAAWLGLGGRGQAPAWGGLRRGSGGPAGGGAGGDISAANARGSLCASAAALAARPPPRALAAALGVVTRLCATLEAPAEQAYDDFVPGVHAWRQEAMGTYWRDSAVVALLIIPLGRAALDRGFQALGRRLLAGPCDDSDVTFTKWREACWKLLTYGFLTVFGVAACVGEPWLRDTRLLWAGWPYDQVHSDALRAWYAAETGLYAYGLIDLLVWEAARGDYWAMILHHVATLALLSGSFSFGFLRVGALIMMLNDFVDAWFEGAKLSKYAEQEVTSTALYLGFVASWAVLRQAYCPLVLCYSILVEAWVLVEQYGPTRRHLGIWAAFNVLVLTLQALHSYWFVFLLQKIEVSVSVSLRVVDRRPGFEPPTTPTRAEPGAASDAVSAPKSKCLSPARIDAKVAKTLLEDD